MSAGGGAAKAPSSAAAPTASGGAPSCSGGESQFFALLSASGATVALEWEEIMKLIIAHPHYRSLATLSERKAAWQRWRAARREEMEAEERAAVRQKKVDFVQMLKECSALSSRLRYKEARRELEGDARWDALENDYEREELYEEYTLSLERKEAAERRQQRRERMDAFRALLVRSQLAVGSQWRRVQVQLEDAPELRALEKIDRLAIFEEVIRGLEAEEEQRRQRAREAHRREERRLRDAFRALLAEKHAAGVFHAKSKWADVEVLIAKEPAFESCLKQSGSAPHELWEDYMEILNEAWQAQRRTLKAVLLAVGAAFTVTPETGFDAFAAALREADSGTLEEVPESAIRAFLIELQEKQLKELADAERKLAQQRKEKLEKYASTLRGLMGALLTSATPWEEANKVMQGKAAANELSADEQRAAYSEVVAALAEEEARDAREAAAKVAAVAEGKEAKEEDGEERRSHKRKKSHRRERGGGGGDSSDEERRHKSSRKKERRSKRSRAGESDEEEGEHKE